MLAHIDDRMRMILFAGGIIVLAAALYTVVWTPLRSHHAATLSRIEVVRAKLDQAQRRLEEKDRLVREFELHKRQLENLEKTMFSEERPSIVGARIQEIVSEICQNHGVSIRTARMMKEGRVGDYTNVPVKIEMDASLEALSHVLYELYYNEYLFLVPEYSISSVGRSANVRVSMTVTGLMRRA